MKSETRNAFCALHQSLIAKLSTPYTGEESQIRKNSLNDEVSICEEKLLRVFIISMHRRAMNLREIYDSKSLFFLVSHINRGF